MSAVFGPSWWKQNLLGKIEIWCALSICILAITIISLIPRMIKAFTKKGQTVAGTSKISPIIPFLLVVVPAYVISVMSKIHIYEVSFKFYFASFFADEET